MLADSLRRTSHLMHDASLPGRRCNQVGWLSLDMFGRRRRQEWHGHHAEQFGEEFEEDFSEEGRDLSLAAREYVNDDGHGADADGDQEHVEAVVGQDKEGGEYVHAQDCLGRVLWWQPEDYLQ